MKTLCESFAAGFSYKEIYPFLFTKISDMKLTTIEGQPISLSKYTTNGKPTVLYVKR